MNVSGPDGAANLPEYVLSRIASFGNDVAQVDSTTGEKQTFQDIWRAAHQTGHWLRSEGLGKGTNIAICLQNSLDYAVLVLGVLQAGAAAALYPPGATPRELDHFISVSKPKAMFGPSLSREQKEVVMKRPEVKLLDYHRHKLESLGSLDRPIELCPAKLESPALLLSSSGTTGLPKAVIIKHSNLLWALSSLSHLMMGKGESALGLMPFFHAYGFGLMMMALCQGSPYIIMNKFNLKDFNKTILQHKIQRLHIVPSLLVTLASEAVPAKTLRSVRVILTGAGMISMKTQETVLGKLEPGAKMYHSYGMTETTHVTSFGEMRRDKAGSAGLIIPCIKAKVIRSDGSRAAPGEHGELCMQGPFITCGYYNNPAATEETFTSDRWLKTGDQAWIDDEGYLFIVDRIKDIIKYQGHSVSAIELEQIIGEVKGVNEVAVIGVHHEAYGEVPKAFVVPDNKSKPTEEEIKEAVSKQLSHYKWLRGGVEFIESIPKTQSMKINRKLLRTL